MLFDVTEEQSQIATLAREFAEREIAPHTAQWNAEEHFPTELVPKLAEAGLLGLFVPEEYGGSGLDYLSYALVIEEIARIDAGVAVTLSVHAMVTKAIVMLGSDEQRRRWLPELASGAIAGFGLTEAGAGSDAARIVARAESSDGGWRLTGRKQWCTNGGVASVVMAMFRTGDDGSRGITAFLVPCDASGVRVERKTRKLGIHTSDTSDLAFDGVMLDEGAVLGGVGRGYASALGALAGGRIGVAAQACGILRASLEASVRFAREREAFGKPIGEFQGVSFKLAQMATKLDAARLLTLRAAALADTGKPFTVEASKAKLFASRAACEGASDAVQIHGGYGYTTEFPVERYYRDAKITEIYEGTSEVLQIVISRGL